MVAASGEKEHETGIEKKRRYAMKDLKAY